MFWFWHDIGIVADVDWAVNVIMIVIAVDVIDADTDATVAPLGLVDVQFRLTVLDIDLNTPYGV